MAFILKAMAFDENDMSALNSLLNEEETRDMILEDPRLFRAITGDNHCLPISLHFYFYVLVRHVFVNAGLDDRNVADYVASLLADYSRAENMTLRIPPEQTPVEYVFEMMAAAARVDERTRFFVQAHIGNHTLFLTGVLANRVEHRNRTRGFPDVGYYQAAGAAGFRSARDHRLAAHHDLVEVYDRLSEDFGTARQALNELSERLVHLHQPAWLSEFLSSSSSQFN